MSSPSRGPFSAFFLRAGFLTAALAIIAGIFGMHIITGAHQMSAANSMPAAAAGPSLELQSMPTGHSDAPGESTDGAAVGTAAAGWSSSCGPDGSCPEMSAGGNACVLSPGSTSLSAPAPGTAPYALTDFGAAAAASTNYSYSPGSPSPGDLCISRT
ncbi:hypothetical protein J2X12_004182 [Pseudarthrobacter oxydans]|uniref:Uncharacterized protein n=1 Tax=Pseudarthrobacter oxydans TaxID=1671 RepID=A0AAW8NJM6_PSEOX|nr:MULTISPECIES: hypothetical protein [Micrococcaceae]MDR7166128.1 hypothetical protein [Pseudarthrobacter oxydans]TNB69741.1 hypothetical protein FHJ30_17490 [Arthrobacter sp. BB-1]